MAHPDDAEILCGGTLIRLADLSWDLHVATTASGDCGSATLPPDQIAEIRHDEGTRGAALLGGTFHCLGLKDVHVAFDPSSIQAVIDLFREIAPTLVFTHPRFDYMLDHEQTHLLARAATFSYAIPNASAQPVRDGSQVPWLYYVDPLEGVDPYSGLPVTPSVHVDVAGVMDRKADALAAHASQREWLRAHHGMDEYLDAMKRHARRRGDEVGVPYAEAFVQHRGHAYPQSDLLARLLKAT